MEQIVISLAGIAQHPALSALDAALTASTVLHLEQAQPPLRCHVMALYAGPQLIGYVDLLPLLQPASCHTLARRLLPLGQRLDWYYPSVPDEVRCCFEAELQRRCANADTIYSIVAFIYHHIAEHHIMNVFSSRDASHAALVDAFPLTCKPDTFSGAIHKVLEEQQLRGAHHL